MSVIPLAGGYLAGSIPWRLVGALALAGATFAGGWHLGAQGVRGQWAAEHAKQAQQQADAAVEVLRFEQARATKVQEIQDGKDAVLRRTGARLADALEQLRNRPERPADMPEAGRAACAGSTGAELSRPDAAFLEREAARADVLRAELGACQDRERVEVTGGGTFLPETMQILR